MCRPTLDGRQKAAGSGSWSVTAGPAVTHRAHIIHFHTSTVFYSITCVQLLRAEPQLCLSLHIKYLYFGPGTHPLAQIMAQATCWITHITAPIRLPWPLAVSAPAAQYGRLGSSVDCRDDVSVHRLSSWITTAVYMHLTDLFVIYLHAIYLFETAGTTCTSFLVQRTETQSSIVTTDMIRAAAAGGYLHYICEARCDRYGERRTLKQPNYHHVFKWEKKWIMWI